MSTNIYVDKNINEKTKMKRDFQDCVKQLYCHCCNAKIFYDTLDDHNKTEYHKIAHHLRSNSIEPIEDIKQKVVEYKMVQKYLKKMFCNDSSSSSEQHNNKLMIENNKIVLDENVMKKIERKSKLYKKNLDHRAEVYERTKSIQMLVNTIQTTTKRLTKLQIHKYNEYLVKYPDNELLLSIQHLVPKIE
jgi:hypothetical protein